MPTRTDNRDLLLRKGFFPEVLPPCFDSRPLSAALGAIATDVTRNRFNLRVAEYIRYSGTKHDGHRRAYGTVHPIPHLSACQFVSDRWRTFSSKFKRSRLALEQLRLGEDHEDRAIVVPTLSELTGRMSSKLRFSPFVLKTDIAQFFPSIYTHVLSWVAHGREQSKNDRSRESNTSPFNGLDWHVQQCQSGQTRGLIVGPDVFRILAEFISCHIDLELFKRARRQIVGGVRHVDDFYIGVRNEVDASVVLSHLRDVLQSYELQINDSKTRVLSGLAAFDDVWAQELRAIPLRPSGKAYPFAIEKAHEIAQSLQSQSPIKLILRRLDRKRCYQDADWEPLEPRLQRIVWHYGHCTDYVCLLLAKRYAIGESVDSEGWSETISALIKRHCAFGHHHEIAWLLWAALVCELPLKASLIEQIAHIKNGHLWAMIIGAFQLGKIRKRPSLRLGSKLATESPDWLHNLVGRSSGYSKAHFSGAFAAEFEHLAEGAIQVINFDEHIQAMANRHVAAISSSKYGYDSESDEDDDELDATFDFGSYDEGEYEQPNL